MEEIIIKEIQKKDSGLVIVTYNGNRQATLNTGWQSQEVDYLEKDVGIGGSVNVEIVQKGDYTNITKVDFKSGKINKIAAITRPEELQPKSEYTPKPSDEKHDSIVAQVMVKCANKMACSESGNITDYGEYLCNRINELTGAYKLALSNLKAL